MYSQRLCRVGCNRSGADGKGRILRKGGCWSKEKGGKEEAREVRKKEVMRRRMEKFCLFKGKVDGLSNKKME